MINKLGTVIFGLGFSILASTLAIGGLGSNLQVYAQGGNDTINMTNATTPVPEKLASTPGEKTFHLFTSEIENVNEDKLGVAGDSFSVNTMVVQKGDKVNVNFYNMDDVQTEKHSFTIDDPYAVNSDLVVTQYTLLTRVILFHLIFNKSIGRRDSQLWQKFKI